MTIVAGYDGTPTSRNGLAFASGYAKRTGERLVIVWVDPMRLEAAAASAAASGSAFAGPVASKITLPPATCAFLDQEMELDWTFVTCRGDAAKELERIADEHQANLIVVGRSANPARHLLGSVTGRLSRTANRPVVVVP